MPLRVQPARSTEGKHINPTSEQIVEHGGRPLRVAIESASLDDNRATINPSQITQFVNKCSCGQESGVRLANL